MERFSEDPRDINSINRTTSMPIILLDVDGVINFHARFRKNNHLWPTVNKTNVKDIDGKVFPVYWSPYVVDKLNYWSDTGLAEIRWLTSWDQCAQANLAPALGLRHFKLARPPAVYHPPCSSCPEGYHESFLSKSDAADRTALAEPERPIVWIDDDVRGLAHSIESDWTSKDTTLMVQPYEFEGVIPEHLEIIESFLVDARENIFKPNQGIVKRLYQDCQDAWEQHSKSHSK